MDLSPPTPTAPATGRLAALNRALRSYQWVKNTLLFVPLVMAHRVGEVGVWADAVLGFVAFSLMASSAYVVNDIADLEADRRHPAKQHRPFASGALSVGFGYVLAPTLIVVALGIASLVLPRPFLWMLVLYLGVTLAYSFVLKQQPVIDVLVLAGLYTLRILAGGAATSIPVSEWLLAFSMFFFLSLALLKRFAELKRLAVEPETSLHGRGYRGDDLALLGAAGMAAGYLSVLVLVFYVASPEVAELYRYPTLIWLVGALLLFWITRIWLLAGRGDVDDDPLLYAAKDRTSYLVVAVTALTLFVATV